MAQLKYFQMGGSSRFPFCCTQRQTRCTRFLLLVLFLVALIKYLNRSSIQIQPRTTATPVNWPNLFVQLTAPPVSNVSTTDSVSGHKCGRPPLETYNQDVIKYYNRLLVDCGKETNRDSPFPGIAFELRNGNELWQVVDMGLACCYQPFVRQGDNNVSLENACYPIQGKVTLIPSDKEFIEVICEDSSKRQRYKDAFPIAHDNLQEPAKINKSLSNVPQLHFAIIVMDAVSRLSFLRKMPASNDYLLNSLGAIPLYGHSILRDTTIENVPPLLTGLSFQQIKQICGELDDCPFIWKEFSSRGYLTSYADDWPIFNPYIPNGFKEAPTDYYFRPLWAHMRGLEPYWGCEPAKQYCFGPRLSFEAILNFMEMVREKADKLNRPSFQFSLTGNLAHNCWYTLDLGELPLLKTLVKFKEAGRVNNSVLILMADHGYGTTGDYYTQTTSGKVEYRYPLAYFVLPAWFQYRFPEEHRNLVGNAHKLTTPYDLYETIKDLMDLEKIGGAGQKREGGRGISLLKPVPEERGCLEAGISLEWCKLCYPQVALNTVDPLVRMAAELMVERVNNLTLNYTGLCEKQRLENVAGASKWDNRDVIQTICNGTGRELVVGGGKQPETVAVCKRDSKEFRVVAVSLQLTTVTPHIRGAVYHAQVVMTTQGDNNEGSVSMLIMDNNVLRVDRYSVTGHCVAQETKPYCICVQKH